MFDLKIVSNNFDTMFKSVGSYKLVTIVNISILFVKNISVGKIPIFIKTGNAIMRFILFADSCQREKLNLRVKTPNNDEHKVY